MRRGGGAGRSQNCDPYLLSVVQQMEKSSFDNLNVTPKTQFLYKKPTTKLLRIDMKCEEAENICFGVSKETSVT
jgi:hypothetical protein